MPGRWRLGPPLVLCLALVLGACSSAAPERQAASPGPPATASTATASTATAQSTSEPSPFAPANPPERSAKPPPAPHPVSLPALMQKRYDGRRLQLGPVLARTSAYTRYAVTYLSGRLRISGVLNVPVGRGPFPVLVLAHGYIDPGVYTTGRGLSREQDYLARQGYAVLHTDYRNHAQSDDDPSSELRLRLGYTEDVINAVRAVQSARLPYLDGERIGLLGRSMGGGVVLNTLVVRPGLVDAAVVYAPVSSLAADNFDRWIRGNPERAGLARRIVATYGSPERRPGFWRGVSARTYFGRVTEPLLVQHGTADESCPIRWSRQTVAALQQHGKDARLLTYEGEPHAFEAAWPRSMQRTVAFFDRHLEVRRGGR